MVDNQSGSLQIVEVHKSAPDNFSGAVVNFELSLSLGRWRWRCFFAFFLLAMFRLSCARLPSRRAALLRRESWLPLFARSALGCRATLSWTRTARRHLTR